MTKEEVLNKYSREIYMVKLQIKERCVRLTEEEIQNIEYRQDPRNRAEEDVKENYMGFISQRLLEGFSRSEAMDMSLIHVNEAIKQAKEEVLKKPRKFTWLRRTLNRK